jgi:phage FluMu protein Com
MRAVNKVTHSANAAPPLPVVRCPGCQRKLCAGLFTQLVIKCPRCGQLCSFAAAHASATSAP